MIEHVEKDLLLNPTQHGVIRRPIVAHLPIKPLKIQKQIFAFLEP